MPLRGRAFVAALDAIAREIERRYGRKIGFVVDPGTGGPQILRPQTFAPQPDTTPFEEAESFLAIMGWRNEAQTPDMPFCDGSGKLLCDNNLAPDARPGSSTWGFLYRDIIARAKRARLAGWIQQGLPTILDVSPGYDGHIVWGKGTGPNPLVGDNSYGYDDPWRNYLSAFKGIGNVGITMTSWNGFTEGMAVMPGQRKTEAGVEDGKKPEDYPPEYYGAFGIPEPAHERTRYQWVRTLYASDPRSCDFWHFVNGAPTHHVYGAICKHWQDLGGQLGLEATPQISFGEPTTSEDWSPGHNRVTRFGIPGYPDFFGFYWKPDIGTHEVHGSIYAKYKLMGEDTSYLGIPTTDELPSDKWCPNGRFNAFENGWIDWCPPAPGRGELVWAHTGPDEGYPGH